MAQKIRRKIRQASTISLSAETLPFIKAGMYWYKGDEFSEELIATKPIKSVVLLVEGRTIYGDTFKEKIVSADKLSSLMHQTTKTAIEPEKLVLPSINLLSAIAPAIVLVNHSLSAIDREIWQGTYLTSSEYACYQFWTVNFPVGVRSFISKGSICKVRKIIEHCVV